MKLALGSDLHLEFGDLDPINDGDAEVLILSGDILIANILANYPRLTDKQFKALPVPKDEECLAHRFRGFLKRASKAFPRVVYIAGNHEFYNAGLFPASIDILKKECAPYPNISFLENETVKIGDATFIGCTLWTDFNRADPHTMFHAMGLMNDYRVIYTDVKRTTHLRPERILAAHQYSIGYIKEVVSERPNDKFVVVGHHAPSSLSMDVRYKHDVLMNGNYFSDLSDFIMDRPQIKLWTHGHTHTPHDYMLGETRVVCNPRGYVGREVRDGEFKFKYLDI